MSSGPSRARIACLVAFVPVSFLSFPHYVAGAEIDLGLVAGWLGPALLMLALRGLPPARAARAAFLSTWLAYAAIYHWIYVVTVVHGEAPPLLGALAPFGVALFTALVAGGFGCAWGWLDVRGHGNPFSFALLWVVADHLRSFLLGGMPWALLGYTQHLNTWLLPLVRFSGVYGLCFVTALGGAALASLLESRLAPTRLTPRLAWLALSLVLLAHLVAPRFAATPALRSASDPGSTLRVAALQGNIDQREKWSQERHAEILAIYEQLSREAAAAGARLIVWPETAIPGPLELDELAATRLARLARETEASYVIGAVGVTLAADGVSIVEFFDSAFVIDPEGRLRARYDKTHLVPFGEYMPLRPLLGGLMGAVASGIAPLDVSAGAAPRAIRLDAYGRRADRAELLDVKLGVPICYELLFPDLVRRFVDDGAGMLLAITNDAWYGRTGAPLQFLAMTAMRSAETGVWTVRAANTGISAVIDAGGRVRERTAIFERGFVIADVPLLPQEGGRSYYVRHGNTFVRICWIALAAIIAAALRPQSRRAPETLLALERAIEDESDE